MTARWPEVKELFHAALQQAPERRSAFLADACAGRSSLRAEIDRLLDAHGKAGSFIEASPVSGLLGRLSGATPVLTGRVLGHYEVQGLIGSGGMGEVYAAQDTELGRTVALKVVTSGDAAAQQGLRREAQHASKLNHPHICTIHTVGMCDERPYVVMEFVEGLTLRETIGPEGLPIETVLRYGRQMADALAHAHERGVVHRDLKSANVMVTSHGGAKILDFGLAQLREATPELSGAGAAAGEEAPVAGTPAYMAPELLGGSAADERSDIWALGVVLYEMAAGRLPFARSFSFDFNGDGLNARAPALPARVPASLGAVIERCLAASPAGRYQRASDLREALDEVAARLATETREGHGGPFVRPGRRRLALASLVATVILAGLAAAFLPRGTTPGPGAGEPPAIAVMYFQNVSSDSGTGWLARGVPSMLLTSLAQTSGLHLVSTQRLHEAARQSGDTSLDTIGQAEFADVARRAGAGIVVVGTIVRAGSEMRIDARLEDLTSGRVLLAESVRGTDVFPMVDELAARIRTRLGVRELVPARAVADVSSASLEAYRLYAEGQQASMHFRLDEAMKLLNEAVRIDPAFARANLELASVSEFLDLPKARIEYLRAAADHADRLTDRERRLVDVEQARQRGDFPLAARQLDELIARYPDFEGAYSAALMYESFRGSVFAPARQVALMAAGVKAMPTSGSLRNLYGYALLSAGRPQDAVGEFEAYTRLAVRESNPYDSLAEAHLQMGDPEKAIAIYQQALTIDPTFMGSRNGRAWAWGMLGRYREAVDDGVSIVEERAFLLSRVGRFQEASRILAAGEREAQANGNAVKAGEIRVLSSLLALDLGHYERALGAARAAARYFGSANDERSRVNLVLVDLMNVMAENRAGRPARARVSLDQLARRYRAASDLERWWYRTLEGDVALAEGRTDLAEAAFAAAEPAGRVFANFFRANVAFILANNLPARDAAARSRAARGDLEGALSAYRQLEGVDSRQKRVPVVEPRYVLATARLLVRIGDRVRAREEYRRFLDFWSGADPDLPELAEARRALQTLSP